MDNNHTGFIRVRASGALNFEPFFHVPCFILLQQLAHLHLRVLLSIALRFFIFYSSILSSEVIAPLAVLSIIMLFIRSNLIILSYAVQMKPFLI